ncbi:MAG: hypothetical protein AAGJ18_31335, partial [Bacteroidota bacterium]
ALLDIQPDSKIKVLVPEAERHPSEYALPVGATKTLESVWQIGPPYGKEVFKLIASDQPMNWRTLDQFRGTSAADFLGIPTLTIEPTNSRGQRVIKGNPSAANINTLIFEIRK